MQQHILAFVDKYPDCLWRTQLLGHITASAWVLDDRREHVLLIHHRKLDRWLQPGGHADGDADALAVAQREVLEETGLETQPISPLIFDLDAHLIPARGSEPAHYHYDIRFLLSPKAGSRLHANEEVHTAEWVHLSQVKSRANERSILRMVEKSVAIFGVSGQDAGM
jgi:8-oxo-dGTP pyrophosphatase MutT (NUDIX family)